MVNPRIVLIAHDVRSCHNIGSLFRTCEGLGVEELFLTGYTPYPISKHDDRLPHLAKRIDKQIEKTSLGAHKTLAWQKIDNLDELLTKLKGEGYLVTALEQASNSTFLHEFKAPAQIALIVGNEIDGISKTILEKADKILEIKMFGQKESFNVVQAAAMAIYSFRFS